MRVERAATALLVTATLLVALSILMEGTASRLLNGLAGVTWFTSAALLVLAVRQHESRVRTWLVAVGLTVLVAFVVTPSDFLPAIAGFGAAGAIVAGVAGRDGTLWARVVVGLYLPLHVGTAILKSVWRSVTGGDASIRTDPPPTAALVPMVMLIAAVAGALVVEYWRGRSRTARQDMRVTT